jgi:hypothetical protein
LNREQIRAARRARKPVRLEVPEWDGAVYTRPLTADESLEQTIIPDQNDKIYTVIMETLEEDEDGTPLFPAGDQRDEDRKFLGSEPFKLVLEIFMACCRVNGLPVGNLEEAMQAFTPTPDASSTTA